MRYVITGASGAVGSTFVPFAQSLGVELLLVGRDSKKLSNLFPKLPVSDYQSFGKMLRPGDVVVHLAVLNNVRKTSEQESISVNRDLAVFVAKKVVAAGIAKFIYISSCHALNWKKITQYARSKEKVRRRLKKSTICNY